MERFAKRESERILALFDFKEIPVLVLESSKRRNLYEMKELSGECALRIYLKQEHYSIAKGFLIDLGYETDRIYSLGGERMKQKNGFSVEIYDHIPYKTAAFKKQIRRLFGKANLMSGYRYIYELDETMRFAYLLIRISYLYATDQLFVRHILDLCLLHRSLKGENLEHIWKMLKKLKIAKLSEKLLSLGYVWFGTREEQAEFTIQEELELYDVMENRILGYGRKHEESIPEVLALTGAILKEEERENRRARRKLFLQKNRDLQKQLSNLFREYFTHKNINS